MGSYPHFFICHEVMTIRIFGKIRTLEQETKREDRIKELYKLGLDWKGIYKKMLEERW